MIFDSFLCFDCSLGLNPSRINILKYLFVFVKIYFGILSRLNIQTHALFLLVLLFLSFHDLLLAQLYSLLNFPIFIHFLDILLDSLVVGNISIFFSVVEHFCLFHPDRYRLFMGRCLGITEKFILILFGNRFLLVLYLFSPDQQIY